MTDPLRARLTALVDSYTDGDSIGEYPTTCRACGHFDGEHIDGCMIGELAALLREPPAAAPLTPADAFEQNEFAAEKLLERYLDNHCANADAEGMSVQCECRLCQDTRTYLGMPTREAARAAAPGSK